MEHKNISLDSDWISTSFRRPNDTNNMMLMARSAPRVKWTMCVFLYNETATAGLLANRGETDNTVSRTPYYSH
jgi:hypothetical protein